MIALNLDQSKFRKAGPEEGQDEAISAGDYFGTTIEGKGGHVWHFDGKQAVRVGVANPGVGSIAHVAPQSSLRDALAMLTPFSNELFVIHRMRLPPGAFYRRIARPIDQHPLGAPGHSYLLDSEVDARVGTLNQMRSLVGLLDTIFQAVHPCNSNMGCFGGSIRNLLILACTECEAQWRGVMAANGYANAETTKDFVKLLPAMRLNEYSVRLQHSPWLAPIAPFEFWSPTAPTKSLKWYDDYNAAKHYREANFERATLSSAIAAVAAVWVMIAAQYGIAGLRAFDDLSRYFHFEFVPRWRYSEVYTHAYSNFTAEAGPRNFSF